MRHQQVADRHSYTKVDVAAVWPVAPQIAPLPVPDVAEHVAEPRLAAPSTPDVPAAVGMMIVASFASLIGAFAIATVGSAHSIFMITISALFAVAFFTVPRLMLAVEPRTAERPDLDRFLEDGIETLTGHSGGKAALVQMLIVPVLLTMGALAMGVARAIYF